MKQILRTNRLTGALRNKDPSTLLLNGLCCFTVKRTKKQVLLHLVKKSYLFAFRCCLYEMGQANLSSEWN